MKFTWNKKCGMTTKTQRFSILGLDGISRLFLHVFTTKLNMNADLTENKGFTFHTFFKW